MLLRRKMTWVPATRGFAGAPIVEKALFNLQGQVRFVEREALPFLRLIFLVAALIDIVGCLDGGLLVVAVVLTTVPKLLETFEQVVRKLIKIVI
jgi:hypothetical protein